MLPVILGLGLVAVSFVVVALARRARRRAAELEAALLEAVRSRAARVEPVVEIEIEKKALALTDAAGRRSLPRRRLMAAVGRGHALEAVAAAAVDLLTEPPRPLEGAFSLKIHGTRVRAHCVTPAAIALRPAEPSPARWPLEDLGLVVTYRVDGRFVTEDQLFEQGVDARDLHGIALAVQRQWFDEELPRRALASGPEVVRSRDGSAAAVLLTLPDVLRPGEILSGRLWGPNRLGLAASDHSWPDGEPEDDSDAAFPARDLRIDSGGYTIL